MMKPGNIIALFSLFIIGTSCQDDTMEEGIDLKIKATASTSTISGGRLAAGRVSSNVLTFTEVMLGVKELEFETEDEDEMEDQSGHEDEGDEVEFEGNYQVDLIAGTSTPDFGLGNLQPGTYDKIEIELGPVLASGKSISIKFTANDVNYEFTSNEEIEIEIEHLNGYQLESSSITHILILLNLDLLMESIDLTNAQADQDGVVRINSTSNATIYSTILSALDDSWDAGEDEDDDDEIDD